MDYQAMYDTLVAESYDEDTFGILQNAYQLALEQVVRNVPTERVSSVCDLAVGTGRFLEMVRNRLPSARLYALDLSSGMLAVARRRLPEMQSFHTDALTASQHIKADSIDLSIAHFVMSYLDSRALLAEMYRVTAPGGFCSVGNTTFEAYLRMQQIALPFLSREELLTISDIPLNAAGMAQLVAGAGFEVVETISVSRNVHFDTFEEAYSWGVRSGFLTNVLQALTSEQRRAMAGAASVFPIDDSFQGAFVLGRK